MFSLIMVGGLGVSFPYSNIYYISKQFTKILYKTTICLGIKCNNSVDFINNKTFIQL